MKSNQNNSTGHSKTKADLALLESEEWFRALFERVPVGIGLSTSDGRVIACNDAMCRMTGYSEAELKCIRLEDTYQDPRDRQMLFQRLRTEKAVRNLEIPRKRKDGTGYLVSVTINQLSLGEESVILTIAEDVTECREAEEIRKKYSDHLERMVEERISKLKTINQELQEEIAERKRVEQALRESEECLKLVLEGAELGTWDQNMKTGEVIRNRRWAEMLGYTLEEIDSHKDAWRDLIHPDDLPEVNRIAKDHETGLTPFFKCEHRMRTKSGQWKWILNCGKIIQRDKEGRPIRATGTHADITERKKMEEALRESEKRYRELVETSIDMIFTLDPKGNFLFTNKAWKKRLGYSDEEVKKTNGFDLIHPEDVEVTRRRFGEVLEGKTVENIEFRSEIKDGSFINVLINGSPIFDTQGKVVSVLGVAKDITERKRTEEELKRSEQDYRGLFESAHDAIIIFNPEEEIILDVNQRACDIYGFDRSEFLGTSLKKISKDVSRGEEHIRLTLGKGFYHHFETVQYRKDGTEMLLEVNASVLDYKGQKAILSINRDITRRKQTEEALRSSERRYRLLFEGNLAGVYRTTRDGQILDCNESFVRLLGFDTREEVLTHSSSEFYFSPTDRQAFITRLQEQGSLTNFECRLRRKDGTPVWILENVSLIEGDEITPDYIQGTSIDITQRKNAADRIQESEEKLKNIFESVNDFMILLDTKGNILDVNQRALDAVGKKKEEIVGKNVRKLGIFSFKELPRVISAFFKALVGGPRVLNTYVEGKDGQRIPIECSAAFIRMNGKVNSVIIVARDITERKKVEEALRQEKDKAQKYLDVAGAMILAIDTDQRVTLINKRGCEVLGYKEREVVGKNWFDTFLPKGVRDEVKETFDKMMSGEIEPAEYAEGSVLTKSGEERIIAWHNVILSDDKGSITGTIISGEDITERKRAEMALRESEERYRTLFEDSPISLWEEDFSEVKKHVDSLRDYGIRDFRKYFGDHPEEVVKCAELMKVIDVNKASLELYQARNKQELKSSLNRIFAGESYHPFIDELVFIAEGKTLFEKEAIIRNLKGDKNHVVMRWTVAPGHEHTLSKVLVSMVDITERKRAEELLRTSEAQLSNAMKIAKLGYWEYDVAKDLFTFNDHFYAIFRTTAEQVGGYTMSSARYAELFVHPDDMSEVGIEIRKAIEATDPHFSRQLEHRIIYADGETGYITVSFFIVKDNQGRTVKTFGANQDITERKQAEEVLRQTRDYLESLFDYANAPIICWDAKFKITRFNHAFEYLAEYRAEEVMGKDLSMLFPEENKEESLSMIRRTLSGEHWKVAEIPILRKSGDIRIVLWNSANVYAKDGKTLIATIAQGQDITERKRAEEALQESEERYRTYVENAPDGIFITDSDGRYIDVNQAACRMTGYSRDDLFNMKIMDLAPSDKPPEAFESFEELKRNGRAHSEIVIKRKDGALIHASLDAVALSKGRYMAFCSDITERKKAEQALRESEERYRSIFNQARDGIVLIDAESGQITDCNTEFEKQTGRNWGEMRKLKIWDLRPPEKVKAARNKFLEVRKSGTGGSSELEFRKPSGEIVGIDFATREIEIRGKKYMQSITRDITEKKKMEAQLIQAERLTAVGTLAYGIAHEFNNILAGILGNAEYGMGSDNPKEVEECFRVIMENCDRARSITNHLLAFSQQREIEKERADITEAVQNVLGLVERELEKQNIKVVREFKPVPEIVCDLGELSEVFLNMITNARDAMRSKGGTLTIEVRKNRDDIEIIFNDTGCGIPDSIKGRIFEPFVTTKGALGQSEIPGTGLGLFLSYGIISRYHGKIEVKSHIGRGSAFTIRIPITRNQAATDDAEREEPAAVSQNLNILLVDDEETICSVVKKFLEADGHSVTSSTIGKKGLRLFKKESFDLVLSDITMPDMDGIKLISDIKSIDPRIKLIALTGHIADEKLKEARRAGADRILIKPFKKENLYRAISQILS